LKYLFSANIFSLKKLQDLKRLAIGKNKFISLPDVVCKLKSLIELDVSDSACLVSLNPLICKLTNLMKFNIKQCPTLTVPPLELCSQGLTAIKQYYKDFAAGGKGKILPLVTITVIGNTNAGKTSLIKTLQSEERQRVLTYRDPDAVTDDTTEVFRVEELNVNGTALRLIDMGGQSVYHMTYQLTLKQNCIPIVVVNMEQYHQMAQKSGNREAVQRLAFDWLAQLYVANPSIGPPKLVFTHKDRFDSESFARLTATFIKTANTLKDDIMREEQEFNRNTVQVAHFLQCKELFFSQDIYNVGMEEDYETYEALKSAIFDSSKKFVKVLPKLWEDVNDRVLGLQTAFSTFDEILDTVQQVDRSITPNQLTIILTYMHDCGKVLWYKDIDALKSTIFHKIEEVTKLLKVMFHHRTDMWRTRQIELKSCFGKEKNADNISIFLSTGIMENKLLEYLVKTETAFSNDLLMAVLLLQKFSLLHGPIDFGSTKCFVVPYYSSEYFESALETEDEIVLCTEIMFKGLSIPQYVYQQLSIEVLRMFPAETNSFVVRRNGVKVIQNDLLIFFVHNSLSRKININVSGAVKNIAQCWTHLVSVTRKVSRKVKKSWPASKMVHRSSCTHCILKNEAHPKKHGNLSWCKDFFSEIPHKRFQRDMLIVLCGEDKVPSPLVYPCKFTLHKIRIN